MFKNDTINEYEKMSMKEVKCMTVDVRESEIIDQIYHNNKKIVSVELALHKAIDPIALFQLTEEDKGNRFYFRENGGQSAFFGYRVAQTFSNHIENKQSIFEEWLKYKSNINLIHFESEYHHLKICGGFQFSSHQKDDRWRRFGLNHFVLPEVLISFEEDQTYITYTVSKEDFSMEDLKAEIKRVLNAEKEPLKPISDVKRIEDIFKDEWKDIVSDVVNAMNEDEKVVLARRRIVRFEEDIPVYTVINQALENEKNSYLFVLESGEDTFLSQTPEQLMRVKDGVLKTKAIAGTIKRSFDEEEDLKQIEDFLNDPKNLQEHQFVVDSILEDTESYIESIDYNKEPKLLKNDHLYHLLTEFKGPLSTKGYISLIDRLHPTPALGGFPKEKALEFIEKHEFGTRGLYGAPVGFIDVYNDCEFIVAIRSMLIKDVGALLFAGCGIVYDSIPEKEIEETALKFMPMMKALGVEQYV